MVQFVFVRHGESETNRHLHKRAVGEALSSEVLHEVRTSGNPALTEHGEFQAAHSANHVASRIVSARVVAVLASPYARARRTAAYAQAALTLTQALWHAAPLSVVERAELREYTPPRKWEALSADERAVVECAASAGDTVGADTEWSVFTARVAASVAMLERDYGDAGDDAVVLVYGHSLHISTLLTHVATQCAYMPPSVDALAIELPNCSVSVAHYRSGAEAGARWRVYKAACACHLGEAATGRHTTM